MVLTIMNESLTVVYALRVQGKLRVSKAYGRGVGAKTV